MITIVLGCGLIWLAMTVVVCLAACRIAEQDAD